MNLAKGVESIVAVQQMERTMQRIIQASPGGRGKLERIEGQEGVICIYCSARNLTGKSGKVRRGICN